MSMSNPLMADHAIIAETNLGGSGPRVAVKDCIDIAGYTTGAGSRAFADSPPAERHAEVVERLIDAGCRIVGKANMHELAYGVTGVNDFTGTPINPRCPDRIVGGSSSGSAAAVAAGLVDFAIGTDTGGSIRMPAACCGIFGLKPGFGAVSRRGAVPQESSLDCIGPMGPDMNAIEQAMAIILPGFEACDAPADVRLGRVDVTADRDINEALYGVLERSRLAVGSAALPLMADAQQAGITLMAAEMAEQFGHLCGQGVLGEDIEMRLEKAALVDADAVAKAEDVRRRFTADVDALLADFTVLVLPTLPSVPPLLEEATDAAAVLSMTALVRPFNVSGHPAVTLPVMTAAGLPAGVQIVGARGKEAELCAIAKLIEPALARSNAPA